MVIEILTNGNDPNGIFMREMLIGLRGHYDNFQDRPSYTGAKEVEAARVLSELNISDQYYQPL